jgi:hypothetical protein
MLTFAKQMPIAPLARMPREHDTRVWRVVEHHVRTAREGLDFSGVTDVGMDETSARRGQFSGDPKLSLRECANRSRPAAGSGVPAVEDPGLA